MSEQNMPFSGTESKIVPVMFGQDLILAARVGEEVFVAIKPISDNLGLSWGSQWNRIQRDRILSEGVFIMKMPLAHHGQETACLRLDLVNGWLFGIDENRVRAEVRETVLRYKRECYRVLFRHFYGGAVNRTKVGGRRQPDPVAARARAARQLNTVRLLGGMTISAFSDVARPVMVHGLGRVFGDGIAPMVRNFGAFRAAGEELKLMGVGLDMVNNSRQGMIADIMDDYGRHTRFERGLQGLANANGLLTLMAPWNASMKQFSGVITMTRILEACEAAAAGRIAPKELERLAAAGISRDTAEQIAQQFAKYGGDVDGVRIANTTAWDAPRSVVDAFKSAVIRDVDRIIVTPGIGDRPLWMSSETGKLLGQFKSFGFASVQRTLISGLQDRDAAALSGAMLMVGLGMLSYAVKAKLAGRDVADADDYVTWLGEGLDRSGLIGWIMDAYNVPAQAWGAETSRYASRSVVESLGGPTFGGGLDLASRVAVDLGRGEFDQGTVHALRRLAPYQNLIGISKAFDAAEQGFNETFGVPVR